jgi:5-oxoprolinase (ATP-hydrolysing)
VIRAAGRVRVAKQLSTDRAPLDVIRELLELAPGAPIPPCHVRMGTTLATNALLERRGARTALVDHARLRGPAAYR